jgi:putative CocE/NonD family hydrolase
VGATLNVPVEMADGTVLRADVHFPTDLDSGAPAPGPFPVVLTQTPYGKSGGAFFEVSGGGRNSYLVERGYIHAVADVRGTGGSGGSFGLFDPIQAQDGVALVHWAAGLPGSNGKVGLLGLSYLGINQFHTAAAAGPGSPLKAILPVVAGSDLYREVSFDGGIPNVQFGPGYLATTGALNLINPVVEHRADPAQIPATQAQHLPTFQAAMLADVLAGGERAYDGEWWAARNPANVLERVVRNGVPAFMVGGWHDFFQAGGPRNFAGLQNAWAGRPVAAAMEPDQPVTGRYQLVMGPWHHVTVDQALLDRLALRWFDTWLKDEATGMAETTTPLHLWQHGAERFVDTARYPLVEADPTALWLGEGGSLSATPPATDPGGGDRIVFTGAGSPCNRATDVWGMGGPSAFAASFGPLDRCVTDDRSIQVGPGALTYTTDALPEATALAGPIDVTVFATSTRPDTMWVATVEDVDESGASHPLSSGALLGSFRALDPDRTWTGPDGRPLMPWHPYTRESAQPVTPGQVTRYDIEVPPVFATIPAGHRLRVTLTTSDFPHSLPAPRQLVNLVGGVYEVQRTPAAASFVHLPLAPAGAFPTPCAVCS